MESVVELKRLAGLLHDFVLELAVPLSLRASSL
jgi:hypothetical protein